MVRDGKALETLVASIEKILLPQSATVTTNTRRYNDAGDQIAEFDIEIHAQIGSTQMAWIIECRDRPESGSAPVQWIEQLAARLQFNKFNKVIAVSTTGFSPGAFGVADRFGIELREVASISPDEVSTWLGIRHMEEIQRFSALRHANIDFAAGTEFALMSEFMALYSSSPNGAFLTTTTGDPYTIGTAFLNVANAAKLFDDVVPNGPPRPVRIRADYSIADAPLFAKTARGLLRINSIEFHGELTAKMTLAPLLVFNDYRSHESGKSIAQTAVFLGNALTVEISRVAETGEMLLTAKKSTAATALPPAATKPAGAKRPAATKKPAATKPPKPRK